MLALIPWLIFIHIVGAIIFFLAHRTSILIMPFILKIWDKGWTSIILMIIVFLYTILMNDKSYKHLRRMVGLPYMIRGDRFPAEEPASPAHVQAHIQKLKVGELVVIGYVIPMIVLWLMVFQPF